MAVDQAFILAVADSHSSLDVLEEIIKKAQEIASALGGRVAFGLHAGDVGIYNIEKLDSLTSKERWLIQKHRNPVEQFFPYLHKQKKFTLPVYAIQGNHEDFSLADQIIAGDIFVENFFLMEQGSLSLVDNISILALGKIVSKRKMPDQDLLPKYMQEQERLRALQVGTREKIDLMLLHEPPYLDKHDRKCSFGNPAITSLVDQVQPVVVLCGHLHFCYRSRVGASDVYGLGEARQGYFTLLSRYEMRWQVRYFHLTRGEITDQIPWVKPGNEVDFNKRMEKRMRRTVTAAAIIRNISLDDAFLSSASFHGFMGKLMAEIRQLEESGTIRSKEQALAYAKDFFNKILYQEI